VTWDHGDAVPGREVKIAVLKIITLQVYSTLKIHRKIFKLKNIPSDLTINQGGSMEWELAVSRTLMWQKPSPSFSHFM
jgi:hypothetical protein